MSVNFVIKSLGLVNYTDILDQQKQFNLLRDNNTIDEYWLMQVNPVYTMGLYCTEEDTVPDYANIPVVQVDRGGKVSYHGPGQIIIAVCVDLKRLKIQPQQFIKRMEYGIINYLKELEIPASGSKIAPGVYIGSSKIASIGLGMHENRTLHGICFNACMDLTPFDYIDVCGWRRLKMTQLQEHFKFDSIEIVEYGLISAITKAIYS